MFPIIIFFNKKTNEIYGLVSGRVHSPEEEKNLLIKPVNVDKKDVGRFIAPYEQIFEIVEEPVTEFRLVDEKTKRVELVEVGKQKVKKAVGLKPEGKFASLVDSFEKDSSKVFDYKVKLDSKGEVEDFVKK